MLVHVDVGFQDQLLPHDTRDPFQGEKRVRHVIQDSEEENQVEDTNSLRADVEDVQLDVFDFRAEYPASEFESSLADRGNVPNRLVECHDPFGAATFALEREEAVHAPISRTERPCRLCGRLT